MGNFFSKILSLCLQYCFPLFFFILLHHSSLFSEETKLRSQNPLLKWLIGPSINDYYQAKKINPEQAKEILIELMKRNPSSALLNKEMAYTLLEEKAYDESLPYLQKAFKLDPHDEKIGLQIGYVLDLLNRKNEALQQFKNMAKSKDPKIYEPAKQAISNLTGKEVVEEKPKIVQDQTLEEYYNIKKNDLAEAEKYLKKLIDKNPTNVLYLKEMGYLALEKKDYNESLKWFNRAESLDPHDLTIVLQKGYLYLQLNQESHAYTSFEKVLKSSDLALKEKARQALKLLEKERAPVVEQQEIDPFTKDLNRYYTLKKEDPAAAESLLKSLIVRYNDKVILFKEMAYTLINRKAYQEAINYVQKVIQLDPKDDEFLLQLGFLYDLVQNKEEAIKVFEKAAHSSNQEIASKAQVALKNLKGEGEEIAQEKEKTKLDLFYEWKEKDQTYACQLLSEYLEEHPDDLAANKEMAFLQLKFKNLEWALYYFEKSYQLDPCNQEVVIQIGTLLYQLHLNQSATAFLTSHICASKTCEERKKYCEVRFNLIKQYARLLPKPYFLELGYNPVYFRRFRDLVSYFYSRLGVVFGPNDSMEAYLKTYITRDTRSQNTGLPQIFADNVWINSFGVRVRPFKHFPYVGFYSEVGKAYDLIDQDRPRWRNDYRGGGFFYREYEPPHMCYPCYAVTLRPFADIYADVSYYSRYQNWIGYGRVRPGVILIEKEEASLRLYGRGFIGLDTKHEYFNNFVELGPGISFHPTDLLNLALRFEWVKGYYIKVDSPSINPYGNRYYDARVQIDYFVVY